MSPSTVIECFGTDQSGGTREQVVRVAGLSDGAALRPCCTPLLVQWQIETASARTIVLRRLVNPSTDHVGGALLYRLFRRQVLRWISPSERTAGLLISDRALS